MDTNEKCQEYNSRQRDNILIGQASWNDHRCNQMKWRNTNLAKNHIEQISETNWLNFFIFEMHITNHGLLPILNRYTGFFVCMLKVNNNRRGFIEFLQRWKISSTIINCDQQYLHKNYNQVNSDRSHSFNSIQTVSDIYLNFRRLPEFQTFTWISDVYLDFRRSLIFTNKIRLFSFQPRFD